MILHNLNILSTFAKIDRLDLLFAVFNRTLLHLSGNTEAELQLGVQCGYSDLQRVLDLIAHPRPAMAFNVVKAGAAEQPLYNRIPFYPQNPQRHLKGEMDTIALAWTHKATIVCNERKVYNFCRHNPDQTIPCLRLEDVLRQLWIQSLMSQADVQTLITQIETHDRVLVNRNEVF
jgi:hypothetical protein